MRIKLLAALGLCLAALGGCTLPAPAGSEADTPPKEQETPASINPAASPASYIKNYPWGSVRITETEDGIILEETMTYTQIAQERAKELMASETNYLIVDVRRQDEFDEGHIPGAICIPNESIGDERPEALPDLEQLLLVYCRSGRRSKEAAQKLADLGYTNIYEFGGILDWTGDIVR